MELAAQQRGVLEAEQVTDEASEGLDSDEREESGDPEDNSVG
jgi:hypothetical protein